MKLCGAAAGHAELTLRMRVVKTEVDDQIKPSSARMETVPLWAKTTWMLARMKSWETGMIRGSRAINSCSTTVLSTR